MDQPPPSHRTEQFQQSPNESTIKVKIPLLYKIIVASLFVIGYIFYRIFYQTFDNKTCRVDAYYNATWNANRWLNDHGANVFIGIGQVLMDLWVIFAGLAWQFSNYRRFILQKHMRFATSAGLFFIFRSVFLNITKMPFDDYIVWHSPGFLSFAVPYDRTRDFYFSGHTGTLVIIMMQMIAIKWYWVAFTTFISLLFMMNLLIITRIHYTIDIMGGIIFALAFHRGVSYTLKYFDYLFSIPFYIGRYFYRRFIKSRQQDDDMTKLNSEQRLKGDQRERQRIQNQIIS